MCPWHGALRRMLTVLFLPKRHKGTLDPFEEYLKIFVFSKYKTLKDKEAQKTSSLQTWQINAMHPPLGGPGPEEMFVIMQCKLQILRLADTSVALRLPGLHTHHPFFLSLWLADSSSWHLTASMILWDNPPYWIYKKEGERQTDRQRWSTYILYISYCFCFSGELW
jgi:hypothetical protein